MFSANTEEIIQTIQTSQSRVLEEGEIAEIELWKRGQKLRSLVNTEEWEILLDTLHQYVDSADKDLRELVPGDPRVVTAHAALSALDQMYRLFKEDIEAAVKASYDVPEALRQMLRGAQ